MATVKALFYIPLKDNDGRALAQEINDLGMDLYHHFTAWTCLGYVKGAYRMQDGTQALDDSKAYDVIFDDSRIGELEQVLRDFKVKTLQEAIYLEIQREVDVRFVR